MSSRGKKGKEGGNSIGENQAGAVIEHHDPITARDPTRAGIVRAEAHDCLRRVELREHRVDRAVLGWTDERQRIGGRAVDRCVPRQR